MKYVRTKDGIYEYKLEGGHHLKRVSPHGFAEICEDEIVKQSDNLKDLFDAYVNVEIDGGFKGDFHVYKDFELAKYAADEKTTVINGAILTDRGLIFVAKFNKKGEWELL